MQYNCLNTNSFWWIILNWVFDNSPDFLSDTWTHSIETFVAARRTLDMLLSVKSWNSLIICGRRINKRVRLYGLRCIETYVTQQKETVSQNIDSLLIFGIWSILEKNLKFLCFEIRQQSLLRN